MNELNNILKKIDIKPLTYQKKDNIYIITTKDNKYVIKKTNKDIYEYIIDRDYLNHPHIIYLDNYIVYEYEEDIDIPSEQKILDLIYLVSLLHKKTAYYKNITQNDLKEIYEDIISNLNFLKIYYDTLMTTIESKEILNPSEYYLARNITLIYNVLSKCIQDINTWYKKYRDMTSWRVCLNHNNLKLDHIINNNLISFEKAKINIPIFDIYKLYKETYYLNDWYDIYLRYNKEFPLLDYEKELLFILILMPHKIEFSLKEYDNTLLVEKEIEYLNNTLNFINLPKNKESKDKEK